MAGEHPLAILPTGAGKSLCYQLPALSRYDKTGALTVVISPLVALRADQVAGQNDRGGNDILGERVAGLAAAVVVDQRGGPIPPVGRQNSPELAFADPQDLGRLNPGQLIFHHAVEHLESCLLSLVQCHILHRWTFSLSNLGGRYRRAMTFVAI